MNAIFKAARTGLTQAATRVDSLPTHLPSKVSMLSGSHAAAAASDLGRRVVPDVESRLADDLIRRQVGGMIRASGQ
jgi:hypothetical protein